MNLDFSDLLICQFPCGRPFLQKTESTPAYETPMDAFSSPQSPRMFHPLAQHDTPSADADADAEADANADEDAGNGMYAQLKRPQIGLCILP